MHSHTIFSLTQNIHSRSQHSLSKLWIIESCWSTSPIWNSPKYLFVCTNVFYNLVRSVLISRKRPNLYVRPKQYTCCFIAQRTKQSWIKEKSNKVRLVLFICLRFEITKICTMRVFGKEIVVRLVIGELQSSPRNLLDCSNLHYECFDILSLNLHLSPLKYYNILFLNLSLSLPT